MSVWQTRPKGCGCNALIVYWKLTGAAAELKWLDPDGHWREQAHPSFADELNERGCSAPKQATLAELLALPFEPMVGLAAAVVEFCVVFCPFYVWL